MKLSVNDDKVSIKETSNVEAGELNVTECEFEFSEHYNGLVKKAVFTNFNNDSYKEDIVDGKCSIPTEVLSTSATVKIGVYAYEIENEKYKLRYSPTPTNFWVNEGSYIENAQNSDEPTPSEFEQLEQRVTTAESDIDLLQENVSDLAEGVSENTQDIADLTQTVADNLIEAKEYTDFEIDSLATVAKTGNYSDLENKPFIPTKTSDLINDNGFIDKNVNNLTNYTVKTSTGSLIDLEINGTTYVVTLRLKDIDGNVISTDTIDLPLESVVIGGTFDAVNKKIVLTLENGNTVEIPVGDLVAGLQTEITNENKLASDLVDDTNSGNKFTNTSEKNSWNAKYDKPAGGIPKTDLSSDVQTSLGKADTAIQEHQDISGKEDKTNKVTEISSSSTDEEYPSAKCVYDSQTEQDEIITQLQTELAEAQEQIADLQTEYETNTLTGESIDTTDSAQARADIEVQGNSKQEIIEAVAGIEVSGSAISISDYDDTKESKFTKFSGNTSQDSTTGKNLFDNTMEKTTGTGSATEIAISTGKRISYTGTSTTTSIIFCIYVIKNLTNFVGSTIRCKADFVASSNNIGKYYLGLCASDGSNRSKKVESAISNNEISFIVPELEQNQEYLFLGLYANSSSSGTTESGDYVDYTNIIITIDNNDTSYEPYTGNQASPNPSYPQQIKVVTGNQFVKKSNKNILNINYYEQGSIDGTTGQNIPNSQNARGSNYIPVLPNTNYTISVNTNIAQLRLSEYTNNQSHIQRNLVANSSDLTITTTANTYYLRWSLNYDGTTTVTQELINTLNLMLEKGSSATSYIEHQEQSYPISLGNIELYEDGYISKENGKWYVNNKFYKELFKNGTIRRQTTSVADKYRFSIEFALNAKPTANNVVANIYSNILRKVTANNTYSLANEGIAVANSGVIYFYNSDFEEYSAQDLITYFSNRNDYVLYELETPTKTEITDTTLINQLNAIEDMEGYSGITYIDSEGDLAIIPTYKYNFITPAPSPERESEIVSVSGNQVVSVANSDNTATQSYSLTLGDIVMRGIGNYRDYFFKNNNKWFKKEVIGTTTDNAGSTSKTIDDMIADSGFYSLYGGTLSNKTITYASAIPGMNTINYPKSTSTDVEITDSTLKGQLEEIYNHLKTYQGVTHITTTSESGVKFNLSLDYKKSNLLRIKALEEALEE